MLDIFYLKNIFNGVKNIEIWSLIIFFKDVEKQLAEDKSPFYDYRYITEIIKLITELKQKNDIPKLMEIILS